MATPSPTSSPSRRPMSTPTAATPPVDPPLHAGGMTSSPVGAPGAVLGDGAASFVMRLALGGVMLPHGVQKLVAPAGTIDHFQSAWGVPAVLTVLVIAAEVLGSLGLLVGFATRFCAFAIASVMVGAVFLVHAEHGFFMNWTGQQAGEGFEFHLLAIGLAVALMLRGGGRLSVDELRLRRRRSGRA